MNEPSTDAEHAQSITTHVHGSVLFWYDTWQLTKCRHWVKKKPLEVLEGNDRRGVGIPDKAFFLHL